MEIADPDLQQNGCPLAFLQPVRHFLNRMPHVSTELKVVTRPGYLERRRVCLFVSHAPDYVVKPHVLYHLKALRSAGLEIILILNVDGAVNRPIRVPKDLLRGFVIRKNAGFDFGAWADAFRAFPRLWLAEVVVLVNDSIFGPVADGFGDFIRQTLVQPADFMGLVESVQVARHFQSYFLVLKGRSLSDWQSRELWWSVRNFENKQAVITNYEILLLSRYEQLGFTCLPMLSWRHVPGESHVSPTHLRWRELLLHGFPYIKVELLRDNPLGVDITGWKDEINDPELLKAICAHLAKANAANLSRHAAHGPQHPTRT